MGDDIVLSPHFTDGIDTQNVFAENDRLPGPDGSPGQGMKVNEAVALAELWWEMKGRFSMPDYGKAPEKLVFKSPIILGLPWAALDKQSMLRVVIHWYTHVGIHTVIGDSGTSQDAAKVSSTDDVREQTSEVFQNLDDSRTHTKGSDAIETEVWKDEYEAIDLEDKLLNAQGEELKQEN